MAQKTGTLTDNGCCAVRPEPASEILRRTAHGLHSRAANLESLADKLDALKLMPEEELILRRMARDCDLH